MNTKLALVVLAVVLLAAVGVAVAERPAWAGLGDDRAAAVIVGTPPTGSGTLSTCCKHPQRIPCNTECMPNGTNQYCDTSAPPDPDKCGNGAADCDGTFQPGMSCTTPANPKSKDLQQCTKTGELGRGTCDEGYKQCLYTHSSKSIAFIDCNDGQSLCLAQPFPRCE